MGQVTRPLANSRGGGGGEYSDLAFAETPQSLLTGGAVTVDKQGEVASSEEKDNWHF